MKMFGGILKNIEKVHPKEIKSFARTKKNGTLGRDETLTGHPWCFPIRVFLFP